MNNMNKKWFLLALVLLLLGSGVFAQKPTTSELLQKGIYLQETVGDLEGAIKIYKQVVGMTEESRANAAQAEYRLGVCLQKKGQQQEALETFRKLVKEYPEQTAVVAQAREFLPGAANIKDNPCQSLEDELKGNPGSIALHENILACYFRAEHKFPLNSEERKALENVRAEHLLWYIQHAPEHTNLGPPESVIAQWDTEDYVRLKHEWMRQVQDHPGNANVLVNAARFMGFEEQDEAFELASKAYAADPKNLQAVRFLAYLYERKMEYGKSELKTQMASQALQFREREFDATPKKTDSFLCDLLNRLAVDAFEADDNVVAQKYAEELLQHVPQQGQYDCGTLHYGNLILGRIALKNGNIGEAKSRLLEAGRIAGSASLDSFGPNMMLAKELLEKGQREVVLQYFDECADFWKHDHGKLDEWRAVIRGGGTPDFGANLIY